MGRETIRTTEKLDGRMTSRWILGI